MNNLSQFEKRMCLVTVAIMRLKSKKVSVTLDISSRGYFLVFIHELDKSGDSLGVVDTFRFDPASPATVFAELIKTLRYYHTGDDIMGEAA